jgi:hypothetical protein
MNAIIRKELREHGFVFLASLLSLAAVLSLEFAPKFQPQLMEGEFFGIIFMTSTATAILLAVLQTLKECQQDRWAFLIHRGVSPTQIFLGKVIAGMLIYSVVCFTPVVYLAVKFAIVGVEKLPLDWGQFRMPLITILLGVSVYFSVILVVVRKASWFKSRTLPLGAPVLLFAGVMGLAFEVVGSTIPGWTFAVVAFFTVLIGVAAWGSFIRFGESESRPASATAALGVVLCSVILSGLVFAYCMVVVFVDEVLEVDPDYYIDSVTNLMNDEGEIIRITSNGRPLEIRSVENLTTSKNLSVEAFARRDSMNWYNSTTIVDRNNVIFRFFRGSRNRGFERIQDTPLDGGPIYRDGIRWMYSSADRLFYGYHVKRRGGGWGLSVELVSVLGPDGFHSDSRPQQGFSELLAVRSGMRRGDRFVWPDDTESRPLSDESDVALLSAEGLFLFTDGMYSIDFFNSSIRQRFAAREGKTIRGVFPFGKRKETDSVHDGLMSESICVVYDDVIDVHERNPVFVEVRDFSNPAAIAPGTGKMENRAIYASIPGKLVRSITIPATIRNEPIVTVMQLSQDDLIGYSVNQMFSSLIRERFIVAMPDGSIVSDRFVSARPNGFPWIMVLIIATAAPVVPILSVPILLVLGAILQARLFGLLLLLFTQHPLQALVLVAVFVGVGMMCVASAARTAKRYEFSSRERKQWIIWSFLLGPAGLLTLHALRPWPPLLTCNACQARRQIASSKSCRNCGKDVNGIELNGTEIFHDQSLEHSPVEGSGAVAVGGEV